MKYSYISASATNSKLGISVSTFNVQSSSRSGWLESVKIGNENNYSASIIAGGNYNAGDVESNSVEIINSNINSGQIFGGRRSGGGGLVSSNTVTISDNSTVSDQVYGGNAFGEGAAGRVEYNKVVITESYLGKSAYGGKINEKGSATGNSVDVSENSVITENVYGAEVWLIVQLQ